MHMITINEALQIISIVCPEMPIKDAFEAIKKLRQARIVIDKDNKSPHENNDDFSASGAKLY